MPRAEEVNLHLIIVHKIQAADNHAAILIGISNYSYEDIITWRGRTAMFVQNNLSFGEAGPHCTDGNIEPN